MILEIIVGQAVLGTMAFGGQVVRLRFALKQRTGEATARPRRLVREGGSRWFGSVCQRRKRVPHTLDSNRVGSLTLRDPRSA